MKNFEEYCHSLDDDHKLYFERRENQFRGQKVEKARIIQPSVLMKSVVATLLNQPNRSARDYRGIISEYQSRLFQEEHDVRLYYSSCYLNYRLDFLWRNQKLDTALKIYRYYLMAGIGQAVSSSKNMLVQRRADIEDFHKRMLDICDDEGRLKTGVQEIYDLLDKRVRSLSIDTRERLRDAIRSESFAKSFNSDLQEAGLKI